jgi:hypothetical protein
MDTTHPRPGQQHDGSVVTGSFSGSRFPIACCLLPIACSQYCNHKSTFTLPSSLFTLPSSLLLFLLTFISFQLTSAQPILTSSIHGTVLDAQTHSPLIGASVILVNSNPLVGSTSDINGQFTLNKIPIGPRQIQVTYVGYLTYVSEILTVSSGKVTEVIVSLQETVISGKEVVIRGDFKKQGAINKMATVSVRSFSVDETFRFPGSYNDPARMAANFAGVTSGIDNRNDIIVRGNSPMGIQWRLDEMEIPNPNHFSAVGTTGGPVTVLNNNLLDNSDFFTGAFPAQYGNALSGIFDMRLRNGNNEKNEFWFGIGWNGVEFGSEGPFSKKSKASYLFSYRYSLLELISYTGIKISVLPKYQDLNFKITLPTRKCGQFMLTGMGGLSYIEFLDSKKSRSEWLFPDYGEDLSNGSNLGVIGLTHVIFPNPGLRIKNLIYLVGSRVYTKIDTFSNIVLTPSSWAGENSEEVKLSYMFQLMKKFSAKNTLEFGLNYDYFIMSFADSVIQKSKFIHTTGSHEKMSFIRGYAQWSHNFTDHLKISTGVFGSGLLLNNTFTAEPRIGMEWDIDKKHSLNFGSGLYSQMQPRVIYFILSPQSDGTTLQLNKNLDFSRNAQFAIGYNYLLNDHLRFRTEVYYQYLYDLPVKSSIPQYSLSNQGHEFFLDRQYSDSLLNLGTGQNYGVEFTFERFLFRNYFFLLTSSFFNSTYKGYDKVDRSSAFNVNYVLNAVGSYEFPFGRRKWAVMSFGLRATWAGGNPYVPFDVGSTVATGEPVMDWNCSFDVKYPEYKRISVRFGIKRNLPSYNFEFLLDLQYRTNYTNVYLQRIDPKTGEIRDFFNMGFFPMGTWRIQF